MALDVAKLPRSALGTLNLSSALTCWGPRRHRPCFPGEFCSREQCQVCEPCPAGTYKELDGDAICRPCPNNTYSGTLGAASIAQCKQCPQKSSTEGPGKTTFFDCICDSAMYLVSSAVEEPTCVLCPVGALCTTGSGTRTCAVELPGFSCPSSGPIVGAWERDSSNYMRLLSCPAGSSMINSSTGTSVGIFEHDVQQVSPSQPALQVGSALFHAPITHSLRHGPSNSAN
eukprot:3934094-Rhodomonas_salina.7